MNRNIFLDAWELNFVVDGASAIESLFSPDVILKAYTTKLSKKATKGIDGTTITNFIIDKEALVISNKCIEGTFNFAPYLQKLKLKGKGKPPREIAIPTIRDQLVLFIIKEYLHAVFYDCANIALPNKVVRDVAKFLCTHSYDSTLCFSKYDVDNFYGTIKHDIIYNVLKEKINSDEIINLIMKAVKNITVPATARKLEYKSFKHSDGVPQGLSISNILANIYINNFDKVVSNNVTGYFRYVDDILIFNAGDDKVCMKSFIDVELDKLGLKVSKSKTNCKAEKREFDYLGYSFKYPSISIRQSSIDKFIRSIVAKFSKFNATVDSIEKEHKWMTQELYKQVFLEELNLRITGAISSKKRYGWVFYFIEMNNLTLLKQIDNVVGKFLNECGRFNQQDICKSKKIIRTYFEAKHAPFSGYILNYDKIDTTQQKLDYLVKMGVINQLSDDRLGTEQVDYIFEKTKNHYLSLLELDVGGFS